MNGIEVPKSPPVFTDGLVSIIMPVYNNERHLKESIGSVLAQQYTYWELILIDDASTDASYNLIERYARSEPRIRSIRLEKNSGAAVARNVGLEHALGRYVAFLDADDFWKPEKLSCQLKMMKDDGRAFSFTAIEMIDSSSRLIKGKRPIAAEVDYRFLLSNTVIACSSVVIDRAVVGSFRMPEIRKGQDYATWLSILRGGIRAYGIDRALTSYRVAKGSISSNKFAALKRTWRIYRQQEKLSLLPAVYHFCLYAFHATMKYFF